MNHKYLIDYTDYVINNLISDKRPIFRHAHDDNKIIFIFVGRYKTKPWQRIAEIQDQPFYDTYNKDGQVLITELARGFVKSTNEFLTRADQKG